MRKLFPLLAFSFFAITAQAQMTGTYTVDGSAPASASNYVTVGSAVSDLISGTRADGGPVNGPGVSGPVVIRLVTGTGPYTEQINITSITGASAVNTIRITGGPGREMITYSATTTAQRHVVKIDGARHIILDSLTLLNTGATYGYGAQITNSADSNVVSNCSVITNNTSTSANFAGITISGATVSTDGDWGDDNLISGNTVNGGYYGISMRGTSTTVFNQRNRVLNNVIQNFYYYGVYCYYQNQPEINDNAITARLLATTATRGIHLDYVDLFSVQRNTLNNLGQYGIYSNHGNYQGGSGILRAKIVNNMVGGPWSNNTPYGIYLTTNSRYIDVYHNSVSMTSGNGRAMYILGGLGNDVRNNSLAIFGSATGYALYVTSTTYVSNVDYNNYYAPGSSNFIYIGAAYTTATFIGGGGWNVNSRTGDPVYQNNASNLHTSALQLYDAGTNVGVTDDIDGDARPMAPTAFYDIGADEFIQVLNDAGVVSATSPVAPFAPGVQNMTVVLFNYGSNTLTSAQVNWDVNAVLQTPFAWTGSVSTFTSSSPVTIGTYNFAVATTYNIRVWTSNPNATTDQQINNDTLYLTVCTALNGTYDIGGVGADFATINAAVNALSCGGVTGPVTMNLTQGAGPFNEQVIIPPVAGASAANTIRLNGGANREVVTFGATTTAQRAVFKLNGADYIILDSMRITNTGTTYGYGVQLTSSADNNIVRNCIVQVNTASTATNFAGITLSDATVTTAADNGDNNLIENNTVNGGYYSITMHGLSTTVFDQNNIVRNNTMYNFYYYGVYCRSQNMPVIENNRISARPAASASGYGIYMYYADRFAIEENDIDSVGAVGIYTYYGNYQGGTGTQRARIANNMIGGTWRDGTSAYGIYMTTNSRHTDVWHNSISMSGTAPRALYITAGTLHDVRNNSFAMFGATTGYAAYISSSAYVTQFNYNNYWCPGSANFIYISGAYTPATFVGGGGWNLNSINVDPVYTNNANDLHAMGAQLYDAGANLGVTNDIDGQTRPLAPSVGYDIGADEFTVAVNDNAVVQLLSPPAVMCADSNTVISVVITNYGINSINTMPVTAQVSGYVNTTLNTTYLGNLALGQSDTVTVGVFNSHPGGTLTIEVYSNLAGDGNATNDTITATIAVTAIAPLAVGTDDTVCTGSPATVMVNNDGSGHTWYDAAVAGNLLASGDTFTTPALTANTVYYVESANTASSSLTTQYTGGNGCDGAMFDIVPNFNMAVDSFAVNIGSVVSETVSVYIKSGTYAGSETNSGAWTLISTLNVIGQGAGQPTMIPIPSYSMIGGQTYGVYITLVSANMDYTTGSMSFSNSDLTINTGAGLCALFTTVNAGRIFNGTVYYTAAACPNPVRTPVTVTVVNPPVVTLGNDTSACETFTIDAGNPSLNWMWSTTETTQQITVTTSGQYSVAVSDAMCTGYDTINVTVNTNPVLVTSVADGNICLGESDTMYVSGAMLYNWSSGGIGTMEIVTPMTTTAYTVYGLDANGCTDLDTLVITVNNPVATLALTLDTVCLSGGSVSLSGESPSGGTFSGPGVTGNSFDPMVAGIGTWPIAYDYTDVNGCAAATVTDSIMVDPCLDVAGNSPAVSSFTLYPNPNNGTFTMNLSGKGMMQVKIFDATGRLIESTQRTSGTYSMQISVAGLYMIVVEEENGLSSVQTLKVF